MAYKVTGNTLIRRSSLAVALATCLASPAAAAPPAVLIFSGELSSDDGPVDALVPMTFRVHESPDGADDVLWETSMPAEVIEGLFVVELGAAEPLSPSVFDGGPRYLAVVVGDPPRSCSPDSRSAGHPTR